MRELARHLGFVGEALELGVVRLDALAVELHRDGAAEAAVRRREDDSVGAATQLATQHVARPPQPRLQICGSRGAGRTQDLLLGQLAGVDEVALK